ncbi:hypothetical protein [Candidatus Electrothrix sp.]|uniref:hypothetical protein n=1 Tax=Candidatus Electrothrix sp. TaxID=2170559 RepID=UPI004055A025
MTAGNISLRFWHPTEDLTFLSSMLGLPCHRRWLSGDRRQTPKGLLLKGTYKDSYWASRIEFLAGKGFEEKFLLAINCLVKAENDILKLVQSGGKAEVYLQLPGDINHGMTIDKNSIFILGGMGVDLSFEVFP